MRTLRMRIEPLTGSALRNFALSLGWELSDLAVADRVHGAVDPDHVACGEDGVAVLLSRPTNVPSSTAGVSAPSTDVCGWGRTVTFAATRLLPALGSRPDVHDYQLADVIARTIAVDPDERPDTPELELLLADLDVASEETDLPATPEDAANLLVASMLMAVIRREEQALRLPGLRARAPKDLIGLTSLGPVVRVFLTHLRFWALLAGASIAFGVALIAAGLSSEKPAVWSPGFALALVGVAMMPWLVRSWGTAVVVYEAGFGLKKRTRRLIAGWDDLDRLRIDVRRKPNADYVSVQIFGMLADGRRFHVPRAVFGRQTLVLAAVLDRRSFLHRLSSAQVELQRGQREFGPIRVSQAGVAHRDHSIPWHELTRASRVLHNMFGATATAICVVGQEVAGRAEIITVPEHRIWDCRVLLAVLEAPPQRTSE